MKRVFVSILVILLIAAMGVGGFFFLYPSLQLTEEKVVLEREGTYYAADYVKKANGEVMADHELLDTEEVGEYTIYYTVKKWIFEKEYPFSYEVIDTTPPVIRIKEERIWKNPEEAYTEEEIRSNVEINEGVLSYETDYDPDFSGVYTVRLTAEDDYGNISEAAYEVAVRDEEAPILFRTGNRSRILVGSEFDINTIISYGDNADAYPVLEVEGEVDTSVAGEYPLHAVLTDASGNRKAWDLTVLVVEEIPKDTPSDSYYAFEDFKEMYASEERKVGIDISVWQGDIDFEAVIEAGCEFVIIRIGYSIHGELTLDRKFEQNLQGAVHAGLPVGFYLFCYDNSEENVRSSLEDVFATLEGVDVEYPIIFDWENFGKFQQYNISLQMLNHLYDVFEEEVTARGYASMLYGSKYYLENVWRHTDTRSVWLAHYVRSSSYANPYQLWQVSDRGKIDGIDGYVDLDVWFGK